MLGGPQAGIIVGREKVIAAIKRNPLNRALRIDKFTLCALETVLREYFDLSQVLRKVPTLAMLTFAPEELKKRAQKIERRLKKTLATQCKVKVVPTVSRVGGGALPETGIDSWALDLEPMQIKLSFFEKSLRKLVIPIIGRIENERFLLDVRTVQEREISDLVALLTDFFAAVSGDQGAANG